MDINYTDLIGEDYLKCTKVFLYRKHKRHTIPHIQQLVAKL